MYISCVSLVKFIPRYNTIVKRTVFLILFLDCSLLLYKNIVDFVFCSYILKPYSIHLLLVLGLVFLDLLGFLAYRIVSSTNKDSSASSFALPWIPSKMLSGCGKSEHLYIVPYFRQKVFLSKKFSCTYWDEHVVFVYDSASIGCFSNVKSTLLFWGKLYLVMGI